MCALPKKLIQNLYTPTSASSPVKPPRWNGGIGEVKVGGGGCYLAGRWVGGWAMGEVDNGWELEG